MADFQARLRAWTQELNDLDQNDTKDYAEGLYDYLGDRDKGEMSPSFVDSARNRNFENNWCCFMIILATYVWFLPAENVQASCRDLNKLKMDIIKSRASESMRKLSMLY